MKDGRLFGVPRVLINLRDSNDARKEIMMNKFVLWQYKGKVKQSLIS